MSERVAIVTLAFGERYLGPWREILEPGWRAYADAHRYDVVCITEPPDRSARAQSRSPSWQKCLVLSLPELRDYDRVVWVDADVVINPAAPPIVAGIPREKVGAVDEFSAPGGSEHRAWLHEANRVLSAREPGGQAPRPRYDPGLTVADFYRGYGLPARNDAIVQAGVLVLSPSHHATLLERVYRDYEQKGGAEWNYEMRPLSYELLEAGIVHWLDPRFNCIWGFFCSHRFPLLNRYPTHDSAPAAAADAVANNYFVHFAGGAREPMLTAARSVTNADDPPDRSASELAAPAQSGRLTPSALDTPVAFAVYSRPDLTRQVLEAIREARPRRLFVIADAAPADDPEKAADVAATRRVIESVDWDCTVETNYAERHLGVRERIETGLDWLFDQVPEALIVEDDCLPHPSFFPYCEQLLRHYREDQRVMVISGNNFRPGHRRDGLSYTFSHYPLSWGWATWRRAWAAHDREMSDWPELRESGWLAERLDDPHAVSYWTHIFDQTHRGEIEAWDYRFYLSVWREHALSIEPSRNLVSNLGFRADATNTKLDHSALSNAPTHEMVFPLVHPDEVARDRDAEAFVEDVMYSGNIGRLFEMIRQRRAETAEQVHS